MWKVVLSLRAGKTLDIGRYNFPIRFFTYTKLNKNVSITNKNSLKYIYKVIQNLELKIIKNPPFRLITPVKFYLNNSYRFYGSCINETKTFASVSFYQFKV